MYRLEEKLEDFQETMERVQSRFVDFKQEKKGKQEEEEKKPSEDTEMADESDKKDEVLEDDFVIK